MKRSFAGPILLNTTPILSWLTVVLAPFFSASFGPTLLQLRIGLRQCTLLFGRIGNLIISGFLFYGVLAPLGAIQHLLGRDALRLRLDAKAKTYWIEHQTLGFSPRTTSVVEIVAFLKKRKKLWLILIIALMMFLRIIVRKGSTKRTPSQLIYPLH